MAFLKRSLTFSILLCLCLITVANAQKYKKRPVAVLVQLKAERNRINYLLKNQSYGDLEIFKKDAKGVMLATINDFWTHFNYCPVYYYFDTNYEKISRHNFDGVLLNERLAPVTNPVLNDSSENFFIVYYGYPTWQTRKGHYDTTKAAMNGGRPNGRGLVVNDSKLRQINYIYTTDPDFFSFAKPNKRSAYRYVSRKFDLEYIPFAGELNRQLGGTQIIDNKIITEDNISTH